MFWSHVRHGLLFAALVPLLVAGCDGLPFGTTSAGEIQHSGATFEGREVKLRGTVRQVLKIPLLDIGTYQLEDSTGQVVVVASNGTSPAEGEPVIVRGRVGNLIILAGLGLGTVVQETRRLPVGPLGIAWSLPWN